MPSALLKTNSFISITFNNNVENEKRRHTANGGTNYYLWHITKDQFSELIYCLIEVRVMNFDSSHYKRTQSLLSCVWAWIWLRSPHETSSDQHATSMSMKTPGWRSSLYVGKILSDDRLRHLQFGGAFLLRQLLLNVVNLDELVWRTAESTI